MEPCQLPQNYVGLLYEVFASAYLIGKQEFAMLNVVQWEASKCVKVAELLMDIPGYIERAQKKTDTEPDDSGTGFLD